MMSKIRKMQDSWFAKAIFLLTALSFMSLFGISGYIGSAARNRTVVKVGDTEITQDEISYKYDKQLQQYKMLLGDKLNLTDEDRSQMLLNIVNAEFMDAVIQNVADKYNMVISDALIRKIIYSQPQFLDAAGRFDPQRFRLMLSESGLSEQRYVSSLRLNVERQELILNPVSQMNVPEFLVSFLGKIDNQQRVFKYITINPKDLKLSRSISDEELQQYYQDFSDNFMAPEKRDASFIIVSNDDILSNYKPSQEEIDAYYSENVSQFETPEKRNVLQMVFNDEASAQKAMAELNAGKDFYKVASDLAKQSKKDTELGLVSKDMLIADMGDEVFELKNGGIAGPAKSEFGWHIMKVTSIVPASKMNRSEAEKQIADAIKKEKAYDAAYEFSRNLEDKIGAGASLEDLAKEAKVEINKVSGLTEDGKAASLPAKYKNLAASTDFADAVFSYNTGELSQVTETDDGLLVVRVDKIVDTHLLPIEDVKPQIEKMWADNERDAMTQEIVNDVMNDLENGEEISDVARRFNLKLETTKPLKRTDTFAGLSAYKVYTMFREDLGAPKMFDLKSEKVIVIASQIIKDTHRLSAEEAANIRQATQNEFAYEAATKLVDSFSKDFDVEINYKLLGLAD